MSKRRALSGAVRLYPPGNPLGIGRADVAQAVARYAIRESVAAPERAAERASVREASIGGAKPTQPGRMLVRLIKAGWSLNSNHYGAGVLREAAQSRAWAAGTACYIDHATDQEEQDHPSGSVKNLAAVLTEDARWDEASQSLVAEVRLFHPWRDTLTDMAEHIGMSIRAWVTGEHGDVDGREGFVVHRIEAGRSVDFVTVPAAGGGIISVLEAVGNTVPVAEARNAGHWFESRIHANFTGLADEMFGEGYLTREERITLSAAVGDGLAAFAARVEADAPHLYQRDPYRPPEPVSAPASEHSPSDPPAADPAAPPAPGVDPNVTDGAPPPAPSTTNPEEEPVSGTQTGAPPEQAGIATVPGDGQPPTTPTPAPTPAPEPAPQPAGESVTTIVQGLLAEAMKPLMEQLAAANAREAAREAETRTMRNRQAAAEAVTQALRATEHTDVAASIGARVNARVLAAVPTTAEGAVDDTRLAETITAVITDEATHVRRERANALAEAGLGLPYGVGASAAQESTGDDGFADEMTTFFSGTLGMTTEAAKIAGTGRGR